MDNDDKLKKGYYVSKEKTYSDLSDLLKTIASEIENSVEKLKATIDISFEFMVPDLSPVLNSEAFTKLSNLDKDELAYYISILPQLLKDAQVSLAMLGWFFPIFFEAPSFLLELNDLAAGNEGHEQLNRRMIEFFENSLEEIKDFLVKSYPHRESLFNSAFKAHKTEEYELAILAFFSLVDGICWDETKSTYFQKKKAKPEVSEYFDTLMTTRWADVMLSTITLDLPVGYNKSRREKEKVDNFVFNRHKIMHGEVFNYGTKERSLKAISLLYYVAMALMFRDSEKNVADGG